jgi:hypothetical protein
LDLDRGVDIIQGRLVIFLELCGEAAQVLITNTNSSFVLKFIENFFGVNDAKVRVKESFFRTKVSTNR